MSICPEFQVKVGRSQDTWHKTIGHTPMARRCNALFNYLIILLDDMVYVYILYGFWWFCDVFV